ncbi:bifunctional riboflavin kinase/FAD synthetase [Lutibacter sp.]|uniref:bifunctional riboflavin kinase/FAD synthetase n=1 Tax=Lutibacter sp. TaxID=1925666 RepID=UPI0027338AF5|nr:bifunctional riboflavin kinase/FAD synthetase [Lutibacter sp.]MDP3312758.1 bifunctional riboflavin kinase/FAD synthetase [Lutibacter sp.]
MKIYNDVFKFRSQQKTFVTIGTFDGVHLGHQKVIQNLVIGAKNANSKSVLLTFFPHPRMILKKGNSIELLNTLEERIKLLEQTGLDILIIQEFNFQFSEISAYNFVKNILVENLNILKLVVGYDHQFGKNREGSFEQLKDYSSEFGFKLEKIIQKEIKEIAISSTKIRTALKSGKIKLATKYLGYNYTLTGTVVQGKNLGEKIGFPTANLKLTETYKLIPKTGAYIVKSVLKNITTYGMMNIGYRPTVNGQNQTIEIHFFDFCDNLYNEKIQICILNHLRDERKFDTIENLKSQLIKDKKKSLKFIKLLQTT